MPSWTRTNQTTPPQDQKGNNDMSKKNMQHNDTSNQFDSIPNMDDISGSIPDIDDISRTIPTIKADSDNETVNIQTGNYHSILNNTSTALYKMHNQLTDISDVINNIILDPDKIREYEKKTGGECYSMHFWLETVPDYLEEINNISGTLTKIINDKAYELFPLSVWGLS